MYTLSQRYLSIARSFPTPQKMSGGSAPHSPLKKMKSAHEVLKYFGLPMTEEGNKPMQQSMSITNNISRAQLDIGITQLARLGAVREAIHLLESMENLHQIYPTRTAYHRLIESFSEMNMKKSMTSSSSTPDVNLAVPWATRHQNNLHLKRSHHIYGKQEGGQRPKTVKDSLRDILNHMKKSNHSQPNAMSYNLVIGATLFEYRKKHSSSNKQQGSYTDSSTLIDEFLDAMHADGIKPNISTLNQLLMHCRSAKDINTANQVIRKLVINGEVAPDIRSLHIMLGIQESNPFYLPNCLYLLTHWLAHCYPELEFTPVPLFPPMKKKYFFSVDKKPSADKDSLTSVEYDQILSKTKQISLPDESCFNLVIKACSRSGHWKTSLALLDTMEWLLNDAANRQFVANKDKTAAPFSVTSLPPPEINSGVKKTPTGSMVPSVITIGSAIDACSRSGRWEEALELLKSMQTSTSRFGFIIPNVICYNATITACANAGRIDEALEIFWEMACESLENDRIPSPDLATFETVLTILAAEQEKHGKTGDDDYWKDALNILALIPVNISKDKSNQKSSSVLKDHPVDDTSLPSSLYSSSTSKLINHEVGVKNRDKLEEEYQVLYQEVYRRFFDEFESREALQDDEDGDNDIEEMDWTSSENMFDTPTVCLVSPEQPLAHNAVLRTLASANQWEYALTLLLEMWRDGFPAPDKSSFSTVLRCLVSCDRLCEGVSLFRAAVTAGVYALWVAPDTSTSSPLRKQQLSMPTSFSKQRSNWPTSAQGGPSGWIIDLHGCNTAVASIAFQVALQTRLHFYMSALESEKKDRRRGDDDDVKVDWKDYSDDLVIIVGQGKHSQQQGTPLTTYMSRFISDVLTFPSDYSTKAVEEGEENDAKNRKPLSLNHHLKLKQHGEGSVVRPLSNNRGRLVVDGAAIGQWIQYQHAKSLKAESDWLRK